MIGFAKKKNEFDFEKSIHDQQIISHVESISSFLERESQYDVAPFSNQALLKFKSLEESKKEKAVQQLKILNQLLLSTYSFIEKDIPKEFPLPHPERFLVEKALQFFDLKLRDDFWATVQPHDILEIYNEDGIQVFRTFNFFETSGYSLTDLLINEWYNLWERPKFVLQRIFEYSNGIMSGEMTGVVKMDISKHIVKEIYSATDELAGFTPRSTLVEFGHICPLYNPKNNFDSKVTGIIVSSTAQTHTMGSEDTRKVILF